MLPWQGTGVREPPVEGAGPEGTTDGRTPARPGGAGQVLTYVGRAVQT